MKAHEGDEVQLHAFLNSALHGGACSVSSPGRFTPGERVPDTYWVGDWLGPITGLGAVE